MERANGSGPRLRHVPTDFVAAPIRTGRRLRRYVAPPTANGTAPARHADTQAAAQRAPRTLGEVLLRAEGVTVRFGGLVANNAVDLEVRERGVTAVIGPNGAGKTTLFNVLTGAIAPASGRVTLAGREVTDASRLTMARLGVARTFQSLELFESLTVEENVLVGASRVVRSGPLEALVRAPRARRDEQVVHAIARRAIAWAELDDVAHERAADLPYGLRRRTELARALAAGPRLLLLDEPSAGMDPQETASLGRLIARLVDQLGLTVFLVEHDMSMVRSFVDEVYVLDFGRVIAHGPAADVLRDPRVIEAYLGSREASRA